MSRRRDKILLGMLGVVVLAWLVTWPVRARLNRDTERINREVALQQQNLRRQKTLASGIDRARALLAADPQSPDRHLSLAAALGIAHAYPDAIQEANIAEKLDPHSARPHAVLGQLYDAAGLPDLALPELRLAVKIDPRDADSVTLMAYRYISLGWNREAERALLDALRYRPDSSRLHAALGMDYSQTGDLLAAEKQLLTARKLAPRDPAIAYPLIEVYRHSRQYAGALKTIDAVLALSKDPSLPYLERAETYSEMNDPVAAIGWANAALKLNQNLLLAYYVRGVSHKMEGNTRAAIQDLQQVRSADPSIQQTRLLLGQLYLQTGQMAKGRQLLEELRQHQDVSSTMLRLTQRVAYQPYDPRAHLELGEFYVRSGSLARAIVELKRTLELQPENLDARSWLIRALRRRGRTQEADLLADGMPLNEPMTMA